MPREPRHCGRLTLHLPEDARVPARTGAGSRERATSRIPAMTGRLRMTRNDGGTAPAVRPP